MERGRRRGRGRGWPAEEAGASHQRKHRSSAAVPRVHPALPCLCLTPHRRWALGLDEVLDVSPDPFCLLHHHHHWQPWISPFCFLPDFPAAHQVGCNSNRYPQPPPPVPLFSSDASSPFCDVACPWRRLMTLPNCCRRRSPVPRLLSPWWPAEPLSL